MPPRSAPLPGPALVTKKLMEACWAYAPAGHASARIAAAAWMVLRVVRFMSDSSCKSRHLMRRRILRSTKMQLPQRGAETAAVTGPDGGRHHAIKSLPG